MSADPYASWIRLYRRHLRPNLRAWAICATIAWGITAALYGCEYFLDPRNDFADGGIDGPFAAHVVSYTDEDRPVFALDGPVASFEPGQIVGWISHVCVDKGKFLLARADIVGSNGRMLIRGRERLWTPEDNRCGAAIGGLALPDDTAPGLYELQRVAWTHPLDWYRRSVQLVGFHFRIAQATKRAP